MNWSPSRQPAAPPSKKAAQLDKILTAARSLLAAGRYEEAIAELARKGGAILREPAGQIMLGSIHSLSGRPDKALLAFDAAARMAPRSAQAHFNRGFALKQLGRTAEAAAAYETALRIEPRMIEARHNLAVALNELGRSEEALAAADAAIALNPAAAEGHYNRGIVLAGLARHEEAIAAFDTALKLRQVYPDAHIARSASLQALRRFDAALSALDAALRQSPDRIDAQTAKALVLREAGRLDEALAAAEEALRQRPGDTDALFARAGLLDMLNRGEEAVAAFDELIARAPEFLAARINRGSALRRLRRWEEALAAFDEILAGSPNLLPVAVNRAGVLVELDRFEEAIAICDRAIAAIARAAASGTPADVSEGEVLTTRANAYRHLRRFEESLADYDRAVALRPESVVARADRSFLFLTLGRYREGWSGYEFRALKEKDQAYTPLHPAPLWRGEPLAGRRLLVTEEQGMGDIIQFARYLPELAQEAGEVRFAVRARLHRLLAPALPGVALAEKADTEEPFDFQIRLLSIPGVRQTDAATIPKGVPYLRAEAERAAAWRSRLPEGRLRVGIHWQGNRDYAADHRRSFPLAHFAPLAAIPGVSLISLQKGVGTEQLASLPEGMTVHTLGDDFDAGADAFLDTAAAMEALDLVVSSDSAVVHLAGALGRPVWILLPYMPDWRWQLDREDSPWYPTARLFRQPRSGDWPAVFDRVAAEIAAMLGKTAP